MDRLDKLSLTLLLGTIILILINVFLLYHSWATSIDVTAEPAEITEPRNHLVFHDDTSVTNTGDSTVWVRARLLFYNSSDSEILQTSPGDYHITSTSLAHGSWKSSDDGWYYYALPLAKDQSTKPLIDPAVENSGTCFRLQVELAPEIWLQEKPKNAADAFNQLLSKFPDQPSFPYNNKSAVCPQTTADF